MTETIRLSPHDPLPVGGSHVLVLRRMGEDNPGAVVTEIEIHGAHAAAIPVPGGDLEAAVRAAQAEAKRLGVARVYVVDRTAGKLEQEALHDGGERNFTGDALEDTDEEDGERGVDIRDRPHDAGFVR